MNTIINESISYKELKQWLPRGYTEQLETSTGYKKGYISLVLSGKRNNELIWKEAIALAVKNKQEIKNQMKIVQKNIDILKGKL